MIFLLVDVLAAAGLACVIWHDRQDQQLKRDAQAKQTEISGELDEAAVQALGEAYRHVRLNNEAVAENGEIAILLSNGEENPCAVAMELLLGADEVIARTAQVDPGWRVEHIALDAQLQPGVHQCLARIHFYMADTGAPLGTMAQQVLLTVK
ncbi:MAG: hypothetical protein E7316_01360 [Clostridiales bacterium]|nr:hypothetical protein [Clostridiales bacterium]